MQVKKCLIGLLCIFSAHAMVAQEAYKEGDVLINANYGFPNIPAALVRTAVRLAYPNGSVNNYGISFSNTGVYSGRGEYALNEDFGVGLSVANWGMKVTIADNYEDVDPRTNLQQSYTDNYSVSLSALAIGVRGNYHFATGEKIDPYVGMALGVTKYTFSMSYDSNNPNRPTPLPLGYTFKSGISSYFGTTIGFRYYFAPVFGLNFEFGYDKGAMLMAGLAFKISTKKN